MKKLIAMLLLASLMMGMTVSAFADGTVDRATAEKEEYQNVGITFYYPSDFKAEKGIISMAADDDMLGPGIYFVQCNYVGVTMDWYESALHVQDIKQEDIMKYMNSTAAVFMIIGIDRNRTAEDLFSFCRRMPSCPDRYSETAEKAGYLLWASIVRKSGATGLAVHVLASIS